MRPIIDEEAKQTKTIASEEVMYVPPDLQLELQHYPGTLPNDPDGRLFPSSRKGVPVRPGNFLHRVLKPAALLAGVSVRASAKGKPTSGLIPIAAENILDPVRRESERPEIHPGPHAPG